MWTSETPAHGEGEETNTSQVTSMQLNDDPVTSIPGSEVTNVALLRARLVRLLLDSPNHTRPFSNLILACGYAGPTKNDRRFFTSRVHDMISDGTLQKFRLKNKGGDRVALSEEFFAEREQSSDKSPTARVPASILDSIPENADNGDVLERSGKTRHRNFLTFLSGLQRIHLHSTSRCSVKLSMLFMPTLTGSQSRYANLLSSSKAKFS